MATAFGVTAVGRDSRSSGYQPASRQSCRLRSRTALASSEVEDVFPKLERNKNGPRQAEKASLEGAD